MREDSTKREKVDLVSQFSIFYLRASSGDIATTNGLFGLQLVDPGCVIQRYQKSTPHASGCESGSTPNRDHRIGSDLGILGFEIERVVVFEMALGKVKELVSSNPQQALSSLWLREAALRSKIGSPVQGH
ncbi:hypothetical protein RchiOBHm_Chr5g0041241 [Rosa chinensis]|uniref:Uncharacterized protein n=1 Tax=Rosa chinensis TaxID=74649 RepID=A0A2P6QCR0_ROSCH|nr:hypothetical protein RchiOBHm_Chr5g0041241 [Rosa chinensis]